MRIRSHPGARCDFDHAVDWYIAEAGNAAAARFIDEVARLRALIIEHPRIGAPRRSGARGLVLRSFPYTRMYRDHGEYIQIVAFAHHSRRPDYWIKRS